jgi:hypothetical protein
MAITVNQVSNSQTFGTWLATTNILANLMSSNTVTTDSSAGGSLTTGNGFVNGYFGANYLYVKDKLVGGNISSNGTLSIQTPLVTANATANLFAVYSNGTIAFGIPTSNVNVTITGNLTVNNISTTGNVTLSDAIYIAANGNVGIGNSNPNTKFVVNGAIFTIVNTATFGTAVYIVANGNVGIGNNTPAQKLVIDGSLNVLSNVATIGTSIYFVSNGNVGIGNSTPNEKLVINGPLNVLNNVATIGTSVYFVSNGNVGIGNSTPAVKLVLASNDAIALPVGNTSQRPAGVVGYMRFNTELNKFEGHNGSTWSDIGGSGAENGIFYLNDQVVTSNYTIPIGKNAGTFGPITINSGVSVTVSPGSTWTIV